MSLRKMATRFHRTETRPGNPVAGCTVVTAGCANCYAMRIAARLAAMGTEKYHGLTRKIGRRYVWTGKMRCDEKALDMPRAWRKPRRIFASQAEYVAPTNATLCMRP